MTHYCVYPTFIYIILLYFPLHLWKGGCETVLAYCPMCAYWGFNECRTVWPGAKGVYTEYMDSGRVGDSLLFVLSHDQMTRWMNTVCKEYQSWLAYSICMMSERTSGIMEQLDVNLSPSAPLSAYLARLHMIILQFTWRENSKVCHL